MRHFSGALPLLALAAIACHARPAGDVATSAVRTDSIVLERTSCFGFCPAYRLSVRADGFVTFRSREPRDSSVTHTDMIAPSQFAGLAQTAADIGLTAFPPVIADDTSLCPLRATDHPTATISVFRADSTTHIVDYLGCYATTNLTVAPPLAQLRQFERQIDSVTQSSRWSQRTIGR